jgi:Protein of unknown function (DUF2568)
MLKIINQTIVFLLELMMLGSLAYFGFQKGNGHLYKYTLAIVLPILAIILWGYWAAPKSAHRLSMPYLAIFRLALFLLASYLLYRCEQIKFALIFALASTITQVASIFLEEND